MITNIVILLGYLAAFNAALLIAYGLTRLLYALLGRDWPEGA